MAKVSAFINSEKTFNRAMTKFAHFTYSDLMDHKRHLENAGKALAKRYAAPKRHENVKALSQSLMVHRANYADVVAAMKGRKTI
jgi:hypothetical protein